MSTLGAGEAQKTSVFTAMASGSLGFALGILLKDSGISFQEGKSRIFGLRHQGEVLVNTQGMENKRKTLRSSITHNPGGKHAPRPHVLTLRSLDQQRNQRLTEC